MLRGGFWLYEQALIIKAVDRIGITGCTHPGIIQILQSLRQHLEGDISFVLGGFHLFSDRTEHGAQVVKQFQALNVKKVAPCHYSGHLLISQFHEAYGSIFLN